MNKTLVVMIFSFAAVAHAEVAGMRDPTEPLNVEVVQGDSNIKSINKSFMLQSILYSSNRKIALINDKYVSVGDAIGKAKLVAIDRGSVTLKDADKVFKIYLFEQSIRENE